MNLTFLVTVTQMTIAYIDPGSGSVLISVLVAALAIAFYYLRSFFYEKARYIFKRQNPLHKESYGLVFYTEGSHYWPVFLPVIRELDHRGFTFTYFTSEGDDPALKAEFVNMNSIYIGKDHQAYFVLNRLHADMVIMTTPGLGVLQLKRSKKVRHYCHIVHSLQDTSTYPPYGLDYYDSVLVSGKDQLDIIRQLEKARKRPEKNIRIIGSTYLDFMREELEQSQSGLINLDKDKKTVLLAPSWGDKGFLNKFGERIINRLLKAGYQVIIRPHPQSWKSEAEVLKKIQDTFGDHSTVIWDYKPHGLEAMQHADLLISDLSGVIFDYMFLFNKPVIVTELEIDPRKFDMNSLPSKRSTLMELINEGKIGYQLKEAEFESVAEVVNEVINSKQDTVHINEIKDRIYSYPEEAGKRGADFILEIYKSLIYDK